MGIGIFRRKYIVRRFKPQEIVNGYALSAYEDIITPLNVQPLSADELQALPEGERRFRRLKSFGSLQLAAANQQQGSPGDWLYYRGEWYKCVSAVSWRHTILSHCKAEFAAVAETDPNADLSPPEMGAERWT